MLEIVPLELGELATNTYLITDSDTREAAVIDPAGDGQVILAQAKRYYCRIEQIWCTHAHFDHIGGVGEFARVLETAPVIALHPADRPLWQLQGGASLFGHFLPASSRSHTGSCRRHGIAPGQHSLRSAAYSRPYSRALYLLLRICRGLFLWGSHFPGLSRPDGSAGRELGYAGHKHPFASVFIAR